jgi:hypothetical protein
MYPRSEILFPHRCVASLKRLRGPKWEALVERIAALPERHVDALAFSLMMITMDKCLNCDLGSYKASLGCCACARRAINSFKGTDSQLIHKFELAKKELLEYLESAGMDAATLVESSEPVEMAA